MKNSKNKRAVIMGIILVGLLILAYKTMFVAPEDISIEENIIASDRVAAVLSEVEHINFDITVLNDPAFASLKSIEIPLPSLPVGKKNPFSVSGN